MEWTILRARTLELSLCGTKSLSEKTDAFECDAIEQMTRDRSTETYLRYDWRGQLWVSDDDSDFSTQGTANGVRALQTGS